MLLRNGSARRIFTLPRNHSERVKESQERTLSGECKVSLEKSREEPNWPSQGSRDESSSAF